MTRDMATAGGHPVTGIEFALVMAAAGFAEMVAFHEGFFRQANGVGGAATWLVVHLLVCALLAGWLLWLRHRGRDLGMASVIAAATPVFGPVAPVGALLTYPVFLWFRRYAVPFEAWYSSLFPTGTEAKVEQLLQSLEAIVDIENTAASTHSFMDIVRYGGTEQKSAVISLVARRYVPEFAPVLREAVTDRNPSVRVEAATAIAKVTDRYVRELAALEKAAEARPGDYAVRRRLAEGHDGFAYCGLLDEAHVDQARHRALEAWLGCNAVAPEDAVAAVAVCRLLVRLKRFEVGRRWFEEVIDGRLESAEALTWYMECLYELGDVERLRAVATAFSAGGTAGTTVSPDVAAAIALWAGEAMSARVSAGEAAGVSEEAGPS